MSESDIFAEEIPEEIPTDEELLEEKIFNEDDELNEELNIDIVQSEAESEDLGNKTKQGFGFKKGGAEVDEKRKQGARHNKSLRQEVEDGIAVNKHLDKDNEEIFDSKYDFNSETDGSSTNRALRDTSVVTGVSKVESRDTEETGYPKKIPILSHSGIYESFNGNILRSTVEKICANDPQTNETSCKIGDVTDNLVDVHLVYQKTINTDGSKDLEFKDYGQDSDHPAMNDGVNADTAEENTARSDRQGEEAESFVEDSLEETGRESRGLGGLADDEDSELDPNGDPRDEDANTRTSSQSGSGEENVYEDDEERTEMTLSEMEDMYNAVKEGNIDHLEDCLDKRCSDINMTWYSENLLMAAIRAGQQEMAEFLLDNGVDYNYVTSVIEVEEIKGKKRMDVYNLGCRELALDYGLLDIAEIIDEKNGELFDFIKPRQRVIRLRRPKPPTPTPLPPEECSTLEEGGEEKLIAKNSSKDPEATELNSKGPDGRQKTDVGSDSELHKTNKDNNLEQGRNSSSVANSYMGSMSDIPRRYGLDEGYETMSPKSSPRCSPLNSRNGASDHVSVRGTKASISLQGYTRSRLPKINHHSSPRETGVTDKKIETVGSYAWESKFWHRKVPRRLPEESDFVENTRDRVRTNSPWGTAKNEGIDQYTTSDNFQNGYVKKCVQKDRLHKSKNNRIGPFVDPSYAQKRGSLPDIVRKSENGGRRITSASLVPKISYSAASRESKFGPYGNPLKFKANSPFLAKTEMRKSPFNANRDLFTHRNIRR